MEVSEDSSFHISQSSFQCETFFKHRVNITDLFVFLVPTSKQVGNRSEDSSGLRRRQIGLQKLQVDLGGFRPHRYPGLHRVVQRRLGCRQVTAFA